MQPPGYSTPNDPSDRVTDPGAPPPAAPLPPESLPPPPVAPTAGHEHPPLDTGTAGTADTAGTASVPLEKSKRKRWPTVLLTLAIILLVAVIVASRVNVSYFAVVPGQAQGVGPLLTVPHGKGVPIGNQLLLTDVEIANVSALTWLTYHFDSNAALYPQVDLTGPGVSEAEYNAQSFVQMDEAQLTAAAIALRQLGYPVPEYNAGVLIYQLAPHTNGFNQLAIGEIVTAIDGHPTPTLEALQEAEVGDQVGQTVTLTVTKLGSPGSHQASTTKSIRLSPVTQDHKVYPVIGISVATTQPGYRLPFPVSVSVKNIGGPSAGLAFTLGLIDSLTGGDLTDHRIVCVTGTIDPDGRVGAVGGIPQKTVAAENAGATVFLVPAADGSPGVSNYSQAKAAANGKLKVFPIRTLADALRDLESLGGHLGAAANGPLPGPDGHSVPEGWSGPCVATQSCFPWT